MESTCFHESFNSVAIQVEAIDGIGAISALKPIPCCKGKSNIFPICLEGVDQFDGSKVVLSTPLLSKSGVGMTGPSFFLVIVTWS